MTNPAAAARWPPDCRLFQ